MMCKYLRKINKINKYVYEFIKTQILKYHILVL